MLRPQSRERHWTLLSLAALLLAFAEETRRAGCRVHHHADHQRDRRRRRS